MKKYIIAALAITSIITIAFGLLMYKIGENYHYMTRCGTGIHKRDY